MTNAIIMQICGVVIVQQVICVYLQTPLPTWQFHYFPRVWSLLALQSELAQLGTLVHYVVLEQFCNPSC
jgi:hypothetical protein